LEGPVAAAEDWTVIDDENARARRSAASGRISFIIVSFRVRSIENRDVPEYMSI
jgi:hypothetical protein